MHINGKLPHSLHTQQEDSEWVTVQYKPPRQGNGLMQYPADPCNRSSINNTCCIFHPSSVNSPIIAYSLFSCNVSKLHFFFPLYTENLLIFFWYVYLPVIRQRTPAPSSHFQSRASNVAAKMNLTSFLVMQYPERNFALQILDFHFYIRQAMCGISYHFICLVWNTQPLSPQKNFPII